ncbi:MAG: dehypoxanthine futalosine cyclase [Sedimentisphaerales bacterium]|nr:dehypoxanthine futalosine cyclase [Sedimentisphaerales bacterium]
MSTGINITSQMALETWQRASLTDLGLQAQNIARKMHPGHIRTYVIERNINYTNICQTRCSFCAFSVSGADERAFTLDVNQICAKIKPLLELGGTQILLQGGMNPDLPLSWYEQLLTGIKNRYPKLHIHAFSPPELVFFSRHFDRPVRTVITKLRDAGLDTIPGGGAEILVDRVRKQISPAKCSSDEWLDVMRQAHQLGICTTATMMFGHVETIEERIEHLEKLRSLQAESLRLRQKNPQAGIFTAFTCWPFQPGQSRLGRKMKNITSQNPHIDTNESENGESSDAGAVEQLRMTALARIYLDNIPNIQASWVTQGPKIGQLSLLFGCNDIGSLMMEENVVSAAGTSFQLELQDLKSLIQTAGFLPVQRDYYYNLLDHRETQV